MEKISYIIFIIVWLVLPHVSPTEVVISLSRRSSCNKTLTSIFDYCQWTLNLIFPKDTVTRNVIVDIYSSNLTQMDVQLCRPSVSIGSDIESTLEYPAISMSSSQNETLYQFDRALINFGDVTTGLNATESNSVISIIINAVVVVSKSSSTWLVFSVDYDDNDKKSETWVSQDLVTYSIPSITATTFSTSTFTLTGDTRTEIGKIGVLSAQLQLASTNSLYSSLTITATSSSANFEICSVQLQDAQPCFLCMDSLRSYFKSTKQGASVKLDIGRFNFKTSELQFNTKTKTIFSIVYRILSTATTSSTASIQASVSGATSSGATFTTFSSPLSISPINPTLTEISAYPIITGSLEKSVVNVFSPFVLDLNVDFPSAYNEFVGLQIESTTVDNPEKIKGCKVDLVPGENVLCATCQNAMGTTLSSENSNPTVYDKLNWQIPNILVTNARNLSELEKPNRVKFQVTMQLLDETDLGETVTIAAYFKFGKSTIWVNDFSFKTGVKFTSTTKPDLILSYAYSNDSNIEAFGSRPVFLDIITQPLVIYEPTALEIFTSFDSFFGYNISTMTICKAEIFYVGNNVKCVQKDYINALKHGMITYEKRMLRFKKDKSVIKLGAVCNSATDTSTDDDNLIRLLIYVQQEDYPKNESSIIAALPLSASNVQTTSISFNKQPSNIGSVPMGLFNSYLNGTSAIRSGTFGIVTYVMRIPRQSRASYAFEAFLTSSSLTQGTASFCTFRVLSQGSNVPCLNTFNNKYTFANSSAAYQKLSGSGNAVFCNIATNVSSASDDDSVSVEFVTSTSMNATGSYSITIVLYDYKTNRSIDRKTFSWSVTFAPIVASPLMSSISADDLILVNPFTNAEWSTPDAFLYESQVSIIRYTVTVHNTTLYNMVLYVSVDLPRDQYDLQMFYISHVDENLPCVKSKYQPGVYLNGSVYPYQAILDVGNVCFYPYDPENVTASKISFDIHLRLPINSTYFLNPVSVPINVTSTVNRQVMSSIAKVKTFQTQSLAFYNTTRLSEWILRNITTSPIKVNIREVVIHEILIDIPPPFNNKVSLRWFCSDTIQFCHIKSLVITSMNQNVDGIGRDLAKAKFLPNYRFNTPNTTVYNHEAFLNLGIITNTMYTIKMDNYDPKIDDKIKIRTEFIVTDHEKLNHRAVFTPILAVTLNERSEYNFTSSSFIIDRNGTEKPDLVMNSSFHAASSLASGSQVNVTFRIYHTNESRAEGRNVIVRYYTPNYVSFSRVLSTSVIRNYSILTNNQLAFVFDVLYFDEIIEMNFLLSVDPSRSYDNFTAQLDDVSSIVEIPFNFQYQKYLRYSPVNDTQKAFFTPYEIISYNPLRVVLQKYPVIDKSSIKQCQLSSSVNNDTSFNVFTTGWVTGYNSRSLYQSGLIYITITLGNLTEINRIVLRQLNRTDTIPILRFYISYSDDLSKNFIKIPEVIFIKNDSIRIFTMPGESIKCRYLRIHLIDVLYPNDLSTKTTGIVIQELYGTVITSDKTLAVTCRVNSDSPFYADNSILFHPLKKTLFVCHSRTTSIPQCFKRDISNTNSATEVLSPKVSTIFLWATNMETLNFDEYLYGVAFDKKSYLRSDDYGVTWKTVSELEFYSVLENRRRFKFTYYRTITQGTLPDINIQNLTANLNGVSHNGRIIYDWFKY